MELYYRFWLLKEIFSSVIFFVFFFLFVGKKTCDNFPPIPLIYIYVWKDFISINWDADFLTFDFSFRLMVFKDFFGIVIMEEISCKVFDEFWRDFESFLNENLIERCSLD